jgi:hypothetical protein
VELPIDHSVAVPVAVSATELFSGKQAEWRVAAR